MGIGKAPGFKLISLKEYQIGENQFNELNTYVCSIELVRVSVPVSGESRLRVDGSAQPSAFLIAATVHVMNLPVVH